MALAVVFDWYGTLAAPSVDDFWPRLPALISAAGGHPDPAVLDAWEVDHPIEHTSQSSSESTYRGWQRDRLSAVVDRCGVAEPARTALLDDIDSARYSRLFSVFPEVPTVLETFADAGITLGVCSNWDWDLDRQLRHNDIDELFDFVVCSASHGHRKPHPAIFDSVAVGADVDRGQIIFVGDSWTDDVVGAEQAGLVPVHVARPGPCLNRFAHGSVPCIGDLNSLVDLVGM